MINGPPKEWHLGFVFTRCRPVQTGPGQRTHHDCVPCVPCHHVAPCAMRCRQQQQVRQPRPRQLEIAAGGWVYCFATNQPPPWNARRARTFTSSARQPGICTGNPHGARANAARRLAFPCPAPSTARLLDGRPFFPGAGGRSGMFSQCGREHCGFCSKLPTPPGVNFDTPASEMQMRHSHSPGHTIFPSS